MKMSYQEVMNRVYDVFVRQDLGPCSINGTCRYSGHTIHNPEHPGCAVGCLMDPNISRKMDQPSYAIRDAWEDVEHRELIKQTLGDLEEEDIEFLEDLQRWHDDVLVSGHQAFVSDLEVIADEWGLQWPGAKA